MNDQKELIKERQQTETEQKRSGRSSQRKLKNEFKSNYLVDENSAHIDVPEDKTAATAHHGEDSVGATGPSNWWRRGIVFMAILIICMIILQMVTGGGVTPSG